MGTRFNALILGGIVVGLAVGLALDVALRIATWEAAILRERLGERGKLSRPPTTAPRRPAAT